MYMKSKPWSRNPNYIVYEDGSVYSLITNKFLASVVSGKSQYPGVGVIPIGGKREKKQVHRLVAETFLPKPKHPAFTWLEWRKLPLKARQILQEDFQVDHIDGDPENFHVDNLRWVTGKQNRDYWHKEQKHIKHK